MTRGGHRERAGRPSLWRTPGPTKPIRIPEDLVEEVLKFARELERIRTLSQPRKAPLPEALDR